MARSLYLNNGMAHLLVLYDWSLQKQTNKQMPCIGIKKILGGLNHPKYTFVPCMNVTKKASKEKMYCEIERERQEIDKIPSTFF